MLFRRATSLAPRAFKAATAQRFAPASMLSSSASMVCSETAPSMKSFSTMHVCGPTCSHNVGHSCSGPSCAFCNATKKTTGVRQMSSAPATPDAAIEALEAGNARFAASDITAPNRSMDRLKELEGGQAPFAAFLSCADSRVPVEMIFDQGFGDVFVCRIAGNIVNTETIGSLEFGTAVLGAKVLYVLGHSSCGAVNATMAGAEVPGVISSLYYQIKPACEHTDDLDTAIAENVKVQVAQLETSPVLKGLVESGDLKIIGGVYDLTTGKCDRVC